MFPILLAIFALLVMLRILTWLLPWSLLSPVYILISAYLLVLCLGGFIYDPRYGGGGGRFPITPEEARSLAEAVLWLVACFGLGAIISGFWDKAKRARAPSLKLRLPKRPLTSSQAFLALLFGVFAIASLTVGAGLSNVIWRTEYLTQEHHIFKIFGQSLLPPAILGLGAAFTTKHQLFRGLALALTGVAFVLTLALNTRLFCLIPLLFFAGALIIGVKNNHFMRGLTVAIFITPLLMIFPLTGREMNEQGVLAFPQMLAEVARIDVDTSIHELSNDIFISAPITIESQQAEVGGALEYLAVSLNPLPGFMTSWNETTRLINKQTPFNAIGDLLRAGTLPACLYFCLIGIYFGRIDRKIRSATKPDASLLCLLALSYLFVVLTLQYPLRNCTRLIYYMPCIEIAFFLIPKLAGRKSRKKYKKLHASLQVPLQQFRSIPTVPERIS